MQSTVSDLALCLVPLLYTGGAILTTLLTPATGWRVLQYANAIALLCAVVAALGPAPASPWFLHGVPSITVLILVSFIGLIVVRFSTHYMGGDPGQQRFQRWLQMTLACVAIVVTANHMALLIAAWIGISLCLHQLLMFYPERKRAALAAHKKFLFARLAEACLVAAAILLYQHHGTLLISEMMDLYSRDGALTLSWQEQLAALLIASAAMVKCAQFPMHGWLIQVVESPTPVSALLHAGIINLGGYLLLITAPLMLQADAARWLVLVVAGLTCVIASLIMMTRVTIKVMLAWSTVSQMGLMLVECALGQYGLALLHLIAHSCYKAYNFLNSGSQVENFLREQLALAERSSVLRLPVLLLSALAIAGLTAAVTGYSFPADSSLWLLFGLMLLVLLTERSSLVQDGGLLETLSLMTLLCAAYVIQKMLFNAIEPPAYQGAGILANAWCAILFLALLFAHWLLRYRPESPVGRRLYRNLFAGLYLDEWATRVTLALWPARLPQRRRQTAVAEGIQTTGARI